MHYYRETYLRTGFDKTPDEARRDGIYGAAVFVAIIAMLVLVRAFE